MRFIAAALRRIFGNLDGPLLAIVSLILIGGLFTLYSATSDQPGRFNSQLMNIAVGFVAMWLAAQVPPQTLMRLAAPLFIVGLILLVLVALRGEVVNGARRWLHVGVTRIQPSEVMKIAMPMVLAWFFHRSQEGLRFREFAVAAVILVVPTWLIARQPDLGTAMLVAAAGFYVIFLAGLSWKILVGFAVAGAASLPFVWSMLHDYQRKRVLTFIDPQTDPLGAGYHIIQSTIALGSGGVFGKGWMNGSQAQLEFLPERSTDFIFAVIGEEFGLLGLALLLLLYAFVVGRAIYLSTQTQDTFARLLAGSLALTFFVYVFINAGMVSGLLPVVGVPLPLVSYGGTSMVTLLAGFGILMSLYSHRKLIGS